MERKNCELREALPNCKPRCNIQPTCKYMSRGDTLLLNGHMSSILLRPVQDVTVYLDVDVITRNGRINCGVGCMLLKLIETRDFDCTRKRQRSNPP